MAFSLNPITVLKGEVLKVKDKAGKPIVLDALGEVEKYLLVLDRFVSRLDTADIQSILGMLPARVLSKFPAGELSAFSDAVIALPSALKAAEAEVLVLEKELSS
jgi:hypothetical protein